MQTQTVEVYIDVAQNAESKLDDGEPKFIGEYVLRALDGAGIVLQEADVTLDNQRLCPPDCPGCCVGRAA